ncbi:hypothetical protein BDQ12DRAFT_678331 [Crucibulum laeve]|uniref:Uncharacterized protein n=1 Tax=Crucibulum laeve TaxID=68775 RepID=A0A5C3MAM5_9AGAR|nr:hypothetical protein BDQ12DRAFT_678331 [Crucibulum laeve]
MIVDFVDEKVSRPERPIVSCSTVQVPPPYSRSIASSSQTDIPYYDYESQPAASASTSYYSQSDYTYGHSHYASDWDQSKHSPPPAFLRQPSRSSTYTSFSPMYLIARSRYLNKGFPPFPPPSSSRHHPFATHDIAMEDWLSFLEDVQSSTTLTLLDKGLVHLPAVALLPVVAFLPIINSIASYGIKSYMKSRKSNVVADVVDQWNHHYFNPRRMSVILMKGHSKLSGKRNVNLGTSDIISPPRPVSPSSSVSSTSTMSNSIASTSGPPDSLSRNPEGFNAPTERKNFFNRDTRYRLCIVSL